jgi:hypothetical protein
VGEDRDAFVLRSQTSLSDPLGRRRVETFWNSRGQGLATLVSWSVPAFLHRLSLGGYLAPPVMFAKRKGIPVDRRDFSLGKGYSAPHAHP